MTQGEPSLKKLTSLLKRVRSKYAPPAAEPAAPVLGADRVLTELLISMLLWDATTGQARHACKRLHEHLVDLNDLRVCVPEETAEILGEKYPAGLERAMRLRSLLGDIYNREHAVQLTGLEGLGKREARAYLESLEGVTHFAAARTFAIALSGHAAPVDNRLRELLVSEGVASEEMSCTALSTWLERSIGADDMPESVVALQAWADEEGRAPKRDAPDLPDRPATKAAPKSPAKPEPKAKPAKHKAAAKAAGKSADKPAREKAPRPARKGPSKDAKP
ncbi:MAG: hypothetical protein GC200_04785 [Tepidisphaera sp.]|nr:hypothetical protein [Tepidisphaera sp.]